MKPSNWDAWLNVVAISPYAAKVVIREKFTSFYNSCECRQMGVMESIGATANCIVCAKHNTSFDAHMYLNDYATALLVWTAQIWQGMTFENDPSELLKVNPYF